MQLKPGLLRGARRWALWVAASLLAGFTLAATAPALAEFEIQESGVEKGEIELEYRGAVHWGFPQTKKGGMTGTLGAQDEGEFLRQSHDFEFQWGITDRSMVSTTLIADEPIQGDFNLSAVELELQYELIERRGDGIGLAFRGSYGFATRGGEADEIEFGPVAELASAKFLLTLNPLFTAQVGDNRQTDGLGFDYGWRAEYDFAKHWGVGVEMFGQIEDLANAGSFDDQTHSIGPTLFYNAGESGEESRRTDDNKAARASGIGLSLNLGVQLGLTDRTSHSALKFQGTLAF